MQVSLIRMKSSRPLIPVSGLVVSALAAFAIAADCFAANAIQAVTIEQPWFRFIIDARPAAGYMTLRNNSESAVQVVGASSPGCSAVMLHQSKAENGIEHMSDVKKISIPAHGSLTFAPGGYHLMCMHPQNIMRVGGSVPVTLKFADGNSATAGYIVKGPSGR